MVPEALLSIAPRRQAHTSGGRVGHISIIHEYLVTTLIIFTADLELWRFEPPNKYTVLYGHRSKRFGQGPPWATATV